MMANKCKEKYAGRHHKVLIGLSPMIEIIFQVLFRQGRLAFCFYAFRWLPDGPEWMMMSCGLDGLVWGERGVKCLVRVNVVLVKEGVLQQLIDWRCPQCSNIPCTLSQLDVCQSQTQQQQQQHQQQQQQQTTARVSATTQLDHGIRRFDLLGPGR